MPTEKKRRIVEELQDSLSRCTIAIATEYKGMSVPAMTELRRTLREKRMEYRVVKNTLAYLASEGARKPGLKEVVRGPTGVVFAYGNPVEAARVLDDYIRATRSLLTVKGAVLDGRALTAEQVTSLARLPSKQVLISQLLGQMQAPIASLIYTLNAPLVGLVTVLQRHIEKESAQQAKA